MILPAAGRPPGVGGRSLPGRWSEPRLREQMFDSCVLGADPGIARCGLAVAGRSGRRVTLVWAGTVSTPGDAPESERLRAVAEATRAAIFEHHPSVVAIERVAWSRNQVSALHVARATGAIMLAAAE